MPEIKDRKDVIFPSVCSGSYNLEPCCSHSTESRLEQVVAATVLTLCSRLVHDSEDSQRGSLVVVAAGRIRDLQIQDRLEHSTTEEVRNMHLPVLYLP